MVIQQTAQLVIQAGVIVKDEDVFVLESGININGIKLLFDDGNACFWLYTR